MGVEVITALSKTNIDELGGFCPWGISAVKVMLWSASSSPSMLARMLLSISVLFSIGMDCPSIVIE